MIELYSRLVILSNLLSRHQQKLMNCDVTCTLHMVNECYGYQSPISSLAIYM